MAATHAIDLRDEAATARLGAALAAVLPDAATVYLEGPLGAGKTTLVRGMLRAMGWTGRVRSPSYSLLEHYPLSAGRQVLHLDLYRIADPAELAALGLRELLAGATRVCIEWPEKGGDRIPPADLEVQLAYAAGEGRVASLSGADAALLDKLTAHFDAT